MKRRIPVFENGEILFKIIYENEYKNNDNNLKGRVKHKYYKQN